MICVAGRAWTEPAGIAITPHVMMKLADLRREYNKAGSLRRADLNPNPIAQFEDWFAYAREIKSPGNFFRRVGVTTYKWLQLVRGKNIVEVNAMTLATVDANGRPSARIVLLKGVDERGFIFFTQYEGRKGGELAENPNAALVFYWPELERQVCVAGEVAKISNAESKAYFKTRPKGSQLAAWVSRQSEVVSDRHYLENHMKRLERDYAVHEVPMPPYWGGYVLSPRRIEFWQGRPNRLHDRLLYTKQENNTWKIERLAP